MQIKIKVKTKARERKVVKVGDNSYEVWVKEIPEQGKANMAVQKALARHFKISQKNIRILAGLTSKQKIIEIK